MDSNKIEYLYACLSPSLDCIFVENQGFITHLHTKKQTTMKRLYDIIGVTIFSTCITLFMYCNRDKKQVSVKLPVSVEYFKQGQVLYPDYACSDTLIVRDAIGLNKAMAFVEQNISWGSDADCDSLIHVYCDYYIGSFEDQFSKLKALQPTWDSLKIVTAINED